MKLGTEMEEIIQSNAQTLKQYFVLQTHLDV